MPFKSFGMGLPPSIRKICSFQAHLDSVRGTKFLGINELLASGSEDGTISLWNTQKQILFDRNPTASLRNFRLSTCPLFSLNYFSIKNSYKQTGTILAGASDGSLYALSLKIAKDGIYEVFRKRVKEHLDCIWKIEINESQVTYS